MFANQQVPGRIFRKHKRCVRQVAPICRVNSDSQHWRIFSCSEAERVKSACQSARLGTRASVFAAIIAVLPAESTLLFTRLAPFAAHLRRARGLAYGGGRRGRELRARFEAGWR